MTLVVARAAADATLGRHVSEPGFREINARHGKWVKRRNWRCLHGGRVASRPQDGRPILLRSEATLSSAEWVKRFELRGLGMPWAESLQNHQDHALRALARPCAEP